MKTFIMWLFNIEDSYWKGRHAGWFACENMVINRIKEHYPEKQDTLFEDLLQ